MNNLPPINCPQCGNPIKYVAAGISRKTGKKYSEFWSCSQRCGFTWRADRIEPPKSGAETNRDIILIEKIDELNKRLDDLGIYLKSKLG